MSNENVGAAPSPDDRPAEPTTPEAGTPAAGGTSRSGSRSGTGRPGAAKTGAAKPRTAKAAAAKPAGQPASDASATEAPVAETPAAEAPVAEAPADVEPAGEAPAPPTASEADKDATTEEQASAEGEPGGAPERAPQAAASGTAGQVASFDVTLRIRRYNPDAGAEAYWEEFTVRALQTDRVLDALHTIKWELDGSLTFRRSCAHGICGSDAMRINGRNRLACKALLKDLDPSKPITVEPIKGLPVVKDLVVDMEPFFASYREIMPFLITGPNTPTTERRQSPEQRARYDDTTKCILCAACTSSCPVFWNDGQYFGPAAIVNAHRFIFDSRDEGAAQRLEILNDREGVWRCRTIFNCTEACPRGIEVTKAIQEVKRAMITRAF